MLNTRGTLLQRAGSGANDAWNELDGLYRPFVFDWFRRQGVSAVDIDDLSQEVLKTLYQELPSFHHPGTSGAFRAWLRTICLNRLLGYRRDKKYRGAPTGGTDFHSLLQNVPDAGALSEIWDREHHQAVLRFLFKRIELNFEELTIAIFRRLMLDGWSVERTATEFSVSVGKVYVVRSRVLRRLREEGESLLGQPLM